MICLRKTVNKTRRDRIRNTDIRDTVKTRPCLEYIDQQRIKWFGHLVRMQQDQPAAHAYNKLCQRYRNTGKPRKRWIDCVKETCHRHGIQIGEANNMAKERKLHLPTTLRGTSGRIN